MVMGASPALKPLMVCGTPSSVILKFSFFKPISKSPCCVVATASTVTMGASTEIVTPACGAGVDGGGACCFGGSCGGCDPPWGPVGAWARMLAVPATDIAATNNITSTRFHVALIHTLSDHNNCSLRNSSQFRSFRPCGKSQNDPEDDLPLCGTRYATRCIQPQLTADGAAKRAHSPAEVPVEVT